MQKSYKNRNQIIEKFRCKISFCQTWKINRKNTVSNRKSEKIKKNQKRKKFFSENLPVFRRKNGCNITPNFLTKCLQKSNVNKGKFSGKSFRSGIPSICAKNPQVFASEDLKNLGRWKSKAYENYIREGNPDLILYRKVAQKILQL